MKKLFYSIFLFISITVFHLSQVSSSPFVSHENIETFPVESVTFEAIQFKSVVGELELDVYYLLEGVPSPAEGILVKKLDFGKIEFIVEKEEKWCQERVDSQKSVCQDLISQCNQNCQDLNKEIRKNFDDLTLKNENLLKDIKDLKETNFYLKLSLPISAAAGIGLTYLLLK